MKTHHPDERLLERVAGKMVGNDREFFLRVWKPGLDRYRARLEAIGFSGHDRMLDCGSGMGQWLVALAERNREVCGLDVADGRVNAVRELIRELDIGNAHVERGSAEALPFADASFDAVFVYGTLFLTDVRRSLAEIARVLRPGGVLYVTANDVGYYAYLIVEQPNRSSNYDPRQSAVDAIASTLTYLARGERGPASQLVVPQSTMQRWLEEAGFDAIAFGSEGTLAVEGRPRTESFYPHVEYLGQPCVYEALCRREAP